MSAPSHTLDCAGRELDLARPVVMGILNVTPDSFSDGGRYTSLEAALAQGEAMAEQGAAIIDVGGESTRPGARHVSDEQEMDRVLPVIEALVDRVAVPISIDTSRATVIKAAIAVGAGLINDVTALRKPNALEFAAEANVPVCLMHMQGEPGTMQTHPHYDDVVSEVYSFLEQRVTACVRAGINHDQIIIDPGFGFGKTVIHNLTLLRQLNRFTDQGCMLLAGLSRKSMIGELLGLEINDRHHASVALAIIAVHNGANIVRVHDVKATVQALAMWQSVYPNDYTLDHDHT